MSAVVVVAALFAFGIDAIAVDALFAIRPAGGQARALHALFDQRLADHLPIRPTGTRLVVETMTLSFSAVT